MKKTMGYENIHLKTPYQIKYLQELQIVKKVNNHTSIYFTGIIPEEKKDDYVLHATPQDKIEVELVEGTTVIHQLFKGIPTNIAVRCTRGIYYLEVEGISHTYDLDVKLKCRSFQDKNMKYDELVKKVIKDYSGSDYIDCASNGGTLKKFIMQYQETDWEFLKRMASHFDTVLVPNTISDKPEFWFGVPEGKEYSIVNKSFHTIEKCISSYMDCSENHAKSVETEHFTHFLTESDDFFNLGDKVRFNGIELIVVQSTARMKDGRLKYECHLCPKEGLIQNLILNKKIIGAAVEAKIIDTAKDTVRLHLDIDKKQDKETASWFPYSTFYTAEGNSGFYCMPQLGDHVKLYFPTGKEEEAITINSVRKDNESCKRVQNPNTKYWGTNHGKIMKMSGNELKFTAKNQKDGQILIKLDDEKGVEIRSDNEINLKAKKNLTLELDQKASINAKQGIQLVCDSSSIDMDGVTHIKGPIVKVEPQKM